MTVAAKKRAMTVSVIYDADDDMIMMIGLVDHCDDGFPPVAGMSELILCLRGIEGKHIQRTISRTHIGDVSA